MIMNWGYKILITICIFIVAMIGMVVIAMRQDNDLIDDNYYEKELAFQTQIDAGKRLDTVYNGMLLKVLSNQVTLQLPVGIFEKIKSGKIEFLKRDDAKKDIAFDLLVNEKGSTVFPIQSFSRGSYQVRISWENDALWYFQQEVLIIP